MQIRFNKREKAFVQDFKGIEMSEKLTRFSGEFKTNIKQCIIYIVQLYLTVHIVNLTITISLQSFLFLFKTKFPVLVQFITLQYNESYVSIDYHIFIRSFRPRSLLNREYFNFSQQGIGNSRLLFVLIQRKILFQLVYSFLCDF